jgi:tyrosine-protein phosphatase SIW14
MLPRGREEAGDVQRALRPLQLLVFLTLLATACATSPAGPLAGAGIRNFVEVNRELSRGAQPTAEGVATLSSRHIVTIVNLRPRRSNRHAFDDERAAADHAGIAYRNKPLSNWHAPAASDVEEILSVIGDPAMQPVFVHCQRGADRTGTIVAAYRINHDCWTAERAIREARDHGMGWWQFPMRHFIRKWYDGRRGQPCVPKPLG